MTTVVLELGHFQTNHTYGNVLFVPHKVGLSAQVMDCVVIPIWPHLYGQLKLAPYKI